MGQHRCRIFCTKCDQIYNLRRKPVLRHLTGIIRISHTYHALLDSVQKPLGVKCRYVRSHSCMNNHFATSFETLVSQAADGNNLNSRIGCICHIGICTDYNTYNKLYARAFYVFRQIYFAFFGKSILCFSAVLFYIFRINFFIR